jgi:hypothetical protein
VGPQLAKTFEPVCPGIPVKVWRLSAKAAPAESAKTQEAMAMDTFLIFRLLYVERVQANASVNTQVAQTIQRSRSQSRDCR